MFIGKRLNAFSLRSGIKEESILTTLIQCNTGRSSHYNKRRKEKSYRGERKGEIKMFLFAENMTIYVKKIPKKL